MGVLDRVGGTLLGEAVDRGAGVIVQQSRVAMEFHVVAHAGGGQQVADRALVQRPQQSEFVQDRRAQVVQQAMQGASHVSQDRVDRGTDIVHADFAQAGLGQFHVGLDRGDVLPQFVVEFRRKVTALVLVGLQVAARGVAQLVGKVVQPAVDRTQVDILLGHPLAAASQCVGGRSEHQGAGSRHCQEEVGRRGRRRVSQVHVDQGHAQAGDQHGKAGTAPAMAKGEKQHRRQGQHARELRLRRGALGQHQKDRHGRHQHEDAVHQQARQRSLFQPGMQQHDQYRRHQQDGEVVTEQFLGNDADHPLGVFRDAGERQDPGVRCGRDRDHQHHREQQAGHVLRTVQAGMQAQPAQQPHAGRHHQERRHHLHREGGGIRWHSVQPAGTGSGKQFGGKQPGPMAHRHQQQRGEPQTVWQHPVRLRRRPEQQPQDQVTGAEEGS